MTRRLLTIGHSYVVALNRRLADEMNRVRPGEWEVHVAAPRFMRGDLRPIPFEPGLPGAAPSTPVPAYLTGKPHLLTYGRQTRTLVRDGGWDFVYTWAEPYVWSGAQLARWAGRTPFGFLTFQNIPKRYPPPFGHLERFTVGRAAGWVAAGRTVFDTLAPRPRYGAKPGRVIPLGVDLDAFRPDPAAGAAVRRKLGWDVAGPPVIGMLGRFIPAKGFAVLRTALGRVRTPWRLLLVGGGPLEGELRAWAASDPARVAVVTGVPHADVPAYLNAMDVLAAPSQTTSRWREQLGRMLLEAFAAGVPVIGSDSGEIPHVVADAGAVVPEADPAAWAAALGDLLDSPTRRRELSERGLQRARTVYAWPIVARQTLAFFDELLAARSGRP